MGRGSERKLEFYVVPNAALAKTVAHVTRPPASYRRSLGAASLNPDWPTGWTSRMRAFGTI